MVEKVVYKSGKFVDWLGQEHPFVVAGVVVAHEGDLVLATIEPVCHGSNRLCAVPVHENNGDGHLRKSLFLGVAICNPKDKDRFSEELGQRIAYNKALCGKLSQRWLATDISGMMTDGLVEFVVNQEAEFVAAHPENFINGYMESKLRYEEKQQAKQEFTELSGPEQEVIKVLAGGADVNKLVGIAEVLGGDIPSKDSDTNAKTAPSKQ